MTKPRSERRLRHERITIRVTPEERKAILEMAEACGKSEGEYLRGLGLGFVPMSKLDQQHVRELLKVAADQGRLGGLLKLWISELRQGFGRTSKPSVTEIDSLYREIVASQSLLKSKIMVL